jgi:hypothetical protein
MAETILNEPRRSGEPSETATVQSPPEPTKAPKTEKAWQFSKQMLQTEVATLLEIGRTHQYPSLKECGKLLNRTRHVWLIAAGSIFGLIAVVTLFARVIALSTNAREIRHEEAVASATPDRLIARCGEPVEDVVNEIYPILIRTMRYRTNGRENVVSVFSRTAEEKSDWVFLTMKDESGHRSYDTPEAKIAALPCLDSRK